MELKKTTVFAVIFGSLGASHQQYGQFTTADRARVWGALECDGKPYRVVRRTEVP